MNGKSKWGALLGTLAWVALAWTGLTGCDGDGGEPPGRAAECDDQTAHNGLAGSHWAVEPCVSACEVNDGVAECAQPCSTTAPDDACAAMAAAAEQSQVVATFSEVFSETYHAELGVPVEVTLPDNARSYIHFPMTST